MAVRRALAALQIVLLTLAVLSVGIARAQTGVEEAESAKTDADRLVSEALAERDRVEAELVASLEAYQEISYRLGEVAADVDALDKRIGEMGRDLRMAEDDLANRAADAYMRAVAAPSLAVWSLRNVEGAMVAGRAIDVLTGEDLARIARITVARSDLARLEASYQGDLADLSVLRASARAEADHLVSLFATADQNLAAAILDAQAADAAYRRALDALELARAREAERKRQEARQTTTTPNTPTTSGLSRTFRPAVERWRGLVATYFPGSLIDPALAVMQCESLGDPDAYNPYSGASGLYQFIPGTWAVASVKAGFGGVSVFDPEANVAAAAWLAGYYQSLGRDPFTPWRCLP